jgi:prepilin-type N-terminal cleavage/methylation domain-containing protein
VYAYWKMNTFARKTAFTLTELLVVIAIIGVLAGLLLPTLILAKQKAQGVQCMNNHRQLMFAWLTHAHDNADKFAYASPFDSTLPGGSFDPDAWVSGLMDFSPSNSSNWDISRDIQRSPLWDYCGKSAAIFKCPADKSKVIPSSGPFAGQEVSRVRTMSMNLWLGGFAGFMFIPGEPGLQSPPWRLYRRLTDLVLPGPSMTMGFWDQREDSVNYGNFGIDMAGYPAQPNLYKFWQDLPSSYHNHAGGISFTDGHSEMHRWRDARTMPPLRQDGVWWPLVASPNNPDIAWLQERATHQQ